MVKAKTLQVVWHNREPVYTLDFHPSGLLATGGGDKEVKLWKLEHDEAGEITVRHQGSLTGHSKAVNCVRFSPTGRHLASAGDGGELLLWQPGQGGASAFGADADATDPGWKLANSLRGGHAEDVFDVAWAPDASALLSGSIENVCIIWDAERGRGQSRLADHSHYVQGVAWDPARRFLVSQSADRTCRVYGPKVAALGKKGGKGAGGGGSCLSLAKDLICQSVLSKRQLATGEDGRPVKVPMFHDENAGFFRRLAWSPEGSILGVPAGVFRAVAEERGSDCTYLFARGKWGVPALALPALKPVIAVAFCPLLFEPAPAPRARTPASEGGNASADAAEGDSGNSGTSGGGGPFELPYRMVFAVASTDCVSLHDTSGGAALCALGQLHCDAAPITDLAWSCDGRRLAVSSYDGYCSVAEFGPRQLGTPLAEDALPPHIAELMRAAAKGVPCREGGPAGGCVPRTAEKKKPASEEPGQAPDQAGCGSAAKRAADAAPGGAAASAGKKPRQIAPSPVSAVADCVAPQLAAKRAGPRRIVAVPVQAPAAAPAAGAAVSCITVDCDGEAAAEGVQMSALRQSLQRPSSSCGLSDSRDAAPAPAVQQPHIEAQDERPQQQLQQPQRPAASGGAGSCNTAAGPSASHELRRIGLESPASALALAESSPAARAAGNKAPPRIQAQLVSAPAQAAAAALPAPAAAKPKPATGAMHAFFAPRPPKAAKKPASAAKAPAPTRPAAVPEELLDDEDSQEGAQQQGQKRRIVAQLLCSDSD